MMKASTLRRAFFTLMVLSPSVGAPPALGAPGDENAAAKQACVEAHVQFQQLRLEHKLISAREKARACASASCPVVVQRECEPAERELTEMIPTVVAKARDARGNDLLDTKVLLDEKPWLDRLTGVSMPLDPGPHSMTFVAPGSAPVRVDFVISEREKGRAVAAQMGAPAAAPPPPSPAPPPRTKTQISPLAYVFTGLGAAGVASFAGFGLKARSRFNALDDSCAPDCTKGDIRDAKRNATIADVSLAVGALSLGAAAYFWLTPRRVPLETGGVRLQIGATPVGVNAALGGSF